MAKSHYQSGTQELSKILPYLYFTFSALSNIIHYINIQF